MDLYTIQSIKSNPLLYSYLRANSSWYKRLNRSSSALKEMEKEAKQYYKLTFSDRFEKFTNSMQMISTFMDVLK